MVSAALPYVNTRSGSAIGPGGGPGFAVDNGEWHGSLTDLRVGLHFQALERPFALAPLSATSCPPADYYTRGHAANGRHLEETLIGLSVGKSLDPWIPRTYAQALLLCLRREGPWYHARPRQSERRAWHLLHSALERQPVRSVAVDTWRPHPAGPPSSPLFPPRPGGLGRILQRRLRHRVRGRGRK